MVIPLKGKIIILHIVYTSRTVGSIHSKETINTKSSGALQFVHSSHQNDGEHG